jgi:hypothetical protein
LHLLGQLQLPPQLALAQSKCLLLLLLLLPVVLLALRLLHLPAHSQMTQPEQAMHGSNA